MHGRLNVFSGILGQAADDPATAAAVCYQQLGHGSWTSVAVVDDMVE